MSSQCGAHQPLPYALIIVSNGYCIKTFSKYLSALHHAPVTPWPATTAPRNRGSAWPQWHTRFTPNLRRAKQRRQAPVRAGLAANYFSLVGPKLLIHVIRLCRLPAGAAGGAFPTSEFSDASVGSMLFSLIQAYGKLNSFCSGDKRLLDRVLVTTVALRQYSQRVGCIRR